jgi:putative SOS response-associated peptidase YedK
VCGRFTLTVHQFGDVVDVLGAEFSPELVSAYRPRYNIAPGDTHWLLRSKEGRRQILPADWGLINSWSKDPRVGFKQINARAETLSERPAYREAFRSRRCVLPADGFYEWQGPRGKREPLWFHAPDRSLILFAGLYESWREPTTGEWRKTFTIITTEPNELVKPIHNRMPAIVAADKLDDWLDGDDPAAILGPAPTKALMREPVSPRVNSTAHDDPALLDPNDPLGRKQLSLF